ncbi:hypothetical protein B0H11DRAFT_2362277 [Mycena galericulata]|nr:hypothetical protein B0H11DRAFT_2362277 [Mycena galericulata]
MQISSTYSSLCLFLFAALPWLPTSCARLSILPPPRAPPAPDPAVARPPPPTINIGVGGPRRLPPSFPPSVRASRLSIPPPLHAPPAADPAVACPPPPANVSSEGQTGHISENAFTNMRRRDNARRRALVAEDQKIENLNLKLQSSYDSLSKARQAILAKIQNNLAHHDISAQIARLTKAADTALNTHLKLVEEGKELANKGTGKVFILTFDITA